MHRRTLLRTGAALGLGAVAGCTSMLNSEQTGSPKTTDEAGGSAEPAVLKNRPKAVYIPTHMEGMQMAGMASQGDYACALTYSFPHRFWLVTGSRRKKVDLQPADSMHLMPVVWDKETKIVPPDANPQVKVRREGEQVTSLSPWPMLSQPMGFHFGDNVQLPEKGTYQVEVNIGQPSVKRTGSFADGETGPQTFAFEMEYSPSKMQEIMVKDIPAEKEGTKGALKPMGMKKMPSTQVPKPDALPGTVRGTGKSGDAKFVVTTLSDATKFGGGSEQTYLAVSPRTPYNRYVLPLMSLSATLKRGGKTVYDDILRPTLDPELNYHYGAAVSDVQSGDKLTITIDAPPQTARHEGYETAFFEMPKIQLSL